MGTPEFPSLGKHCSVNDCRQLDFLPFTCDRCNEVFCLEHRSYGKHRCPDSNQKEAVVMVCPFCAKGVRLVRNEDPNITWESHVNGDCDPSTTPGAGKQKRCPVPGCRELLTLSNRIRCRDCDREHCLRHRFGPDHGCRGPKKQRSVKRLDSSKGSSGSSSWWGLLTRFSSVATDALHKAKTQGGGNGAAETAERPHQRNAKRSLSRVSVDVCPKCSKAFKSTSLLLEHVERDHGGTSIS